MLRRLYQEKDGAALVEYAVLLTGISLALIVAVLIFSSAMRDIFFNIARVF